MAKSEESLELEQLKQLAEKHEQQLEKLQKRIESMENSPGYTQGNPRHSFLEKLSLKLDPVIHRVAAVFVIIFVSSAMGSAFISATIGEILSLVSFACLALAILLEVIYLFLDRIRNSQSI